MDGRRRSRHALAARHRSEALRLAIARSIRPVVFVTRRHSYQDYSRFEESTDVPGSRGMTRRSRSRTQR